jgi:hypothetical protein
LKVVFFYGLEVEGLEFQDGFVSLVAFKRHKPLENDTGDNPILQQYAIFLDMIN